MAGQLRREHERHSREPDEQPIHARGRNVLPKIDTEINAVNSGCRAPSKAITPAAMPRVMAQ